LVGERVVRRSGEVSVGSRNAQPQDLPVQRVEVLGELRPMAVAGGDVEVAVWPER